MASSVAVLEAELWGLRMARAPYAARLEVLAKLTAAKRDEAPPPPFRGVCCAQAEVTSDCTCSYVTRCAVHGTRHHGTHD